MAVAATRGTRKKALLPVSLEQGLKQGANKTVGVALVLAALLGWAALMSWSVNDPSLNRATDGPVDNLLGHTGAVFADILFQSFGLAAVFLILPVAILGMRFLLNHPVDRYRLRTLSWPVTTALIAMTLTLLPRSPSWPLPQSYGGILGDTLAKLINLLEITQASSLSAIIAVILLGGLSLYSLSFTTGITFEDAKVPFTIEDPEALKQKLKAPANRLSYWWRARQSRPSDARSNQRLWWRNAALDEPPLTRQPQGAPFIQQGGPQTPRAPAVMAPLNAGFRPVTPGFAAAKPATPGQNAGEFSGRNPGHNAHPAPFAPGGIPPMSARPVYAHGQPAHQHLYDFESETPAWAAEDSHRDSPASGKASGIRPAHKASGHPRRGDFILPPIELLNPPEQQQAESFTHEELRDMAEMLQNVLLDFGVKGTILNVRPGPVVTLFEFEPARGTKTSRIVGLADDIARSMSAFSARIAVIPGRNAIGIELPNASFETVFLRELVESNDFLHSENSLPLILGKGIGGEPMITDLADMPHLLIAGTTGAGKSVGINTMLLSLLYRLTPKQCRMIMIDPKMLELSVYDGIPHLLTPVVTDPTKAVSALKWAVREMEDRYRQMSKLGVRNINGFNERVKEAASRGEPLTRTVQTGFDQQTGRAIFEDEHLEFEPMPMIVVVIDEMADLMMVAGKEIEAAIQRLAQMARAAGIHVIMATQRPSVDVITGTIKANFPTRISFQVTSKIDSRTILGKEGAEQLLGRGDMLFMPGGSRMVRVHGAFVGDDEVEQVANHLRAQGAPEYLDTITLGDDDEFASDADEAGTSGNSLYDDAVEIVLRDQKASISYLQRRLSIGYNKAATLVEDMENNGILSAPSPNGKREILG